MGDQAEAMGTRIKEVLLGAAAVATWFGVMLLLTTWSRTDPAMAAGMVATVALGVAIGRWWALLAPAAPTLYVVTAILLAGDDDRAEVSAGLWAMYFGAIGLALVVLVALGVWLRRLVAPPARRAGARARAHG